MSAGGVVMSYISGGEILGSYPLPSVDLWEQTDGQHSYSAAATYGGLAAASAMASRHEPALAARYRDL